MTRLKQRGALDIHLMLALVVIVVVGFLVYSRIQNAEDTYEPTAVEVDSPAAASKPYRFTAAGDFYPATDEGKLVFDALSDTPADFTVGLGDLGYVGNGNEQQWCDLVTEKFGEDYPFQVVAGNHDDGTGDGIITEYVKCLPSQMENTVGEYGIEYYFDFNSTRFIMISPDITTYGYDYSAGSEHYQWTADTIDDAKAMNMEWIVLGMHKNCITPGDKDCEIGADIINLAIEKGVDLILQGHEHSYFRSNQLAFSDTCDEIVEEEFNPGCVVTSGSDFEKGAGTVIVISGTAGKPLRDAELDDEELGYFEALNAQNINDADGFSVFDVEKDLLTGEYISVGANEFSDKFTITSP